MVSAAAVVLMAAGLFAQAKPSFAGKWTRVVDPAAAPAQGGGRGGGGALGTDLTISQDATTLTIEYMSGGQAPAPVKLVYKLDGSESKNSVPGRGGVMEQVAKASWTGSTLTVNTTMANGEQKRTFAIEGGNLVVDSVQPGRDGGPGTPMKMTYKKAM
jgi:hypothetical protein